MGSIFQYLWSAAVVSKLGMDEEVKAAVAPCWSGWGWALKLGVFSDGPTALGGLLTRAYGASTGGA